MARFIQAWRENGREPPGVRSVSLRPADRIHVCGNCLDLVRLERGATHRRHRASGLLRLRDTLSDGLDNPVETSVAPEPWAAGDVSPHWAAASIPTAPSPPGATSHLAVAAPATQAHRPLGPTG